MNEEMTDIRKAFEVGINTHCRRRNEVGDYVIPEVDDAWNGFDRGYKAALANDKEKEPAAWAQLWVLPETGDYVEVTYSRDKPELTKSTNEIVPLYTHPQRTEVIK